MQPCPFLNSHDSMYAHLCLRLMAHEQLPLPYTSTIPIFSSGASSFSEIISERLCQLEQYVPSELDGTFEQFPYYIENVLTCAHYLEDRINMVGLSCKMSQGSL
ncbi:hypothetical protein PIB30_073482 [Stylosanthes scabra]|uniref:Uncharacterized protein n=1 Tax=Stylosanthes scabra TaxID=79078 RepID=A0ABU6YPY5_9FABA|nr:hypothetical protein [Stylosanthes scabra]